MKPLYLAYTLQLSPLILAATLFSKANPALSQASNIVPDNTLGEESSQVIENQNVNGLPIEVITGGAQREQNLFHSFQEFNVSEGRGAIFANPDAVNNIFSRVTGNNVSNILGALGVGGAANLYLINPNGIIFGENSSLVVQGSFTATTANGIRFGEQGEFNTINPQLPQLLTINPSAYLFNQVATGAIANNSRASADFNPSPSFDDNFFGLRVPNGRSLLLLGGDVNANGGGLVANGGRIEIGAIAGEGVVEINENSSLNISNDISRADVSLANGAGFLVAGEGGGDIALAAKNVDILSASSLTAGIYSNLGSPNAQAGDINLNATGTVSVKDDNSFILNDVNFGGVGNAGNINIITGSLDLTNGGLVEASTYSQGNAGSINIFAEELVNVNDGKGNTFIANNIYSDATGNSQGINFVVGSLFVNNGAQIQSLTEGQGNSGKIFINARDTVGFDGRDDNDFASSAFSNVEEDAIGNAGGIEIIAPSLSLTNRAQFSSSTQGIGNAGNINIQVEGEVKLVESQILSDISAPNENGIAGNGGFGDGGDVTIDANSLLLKDGSSINTDTENVGDAGDITIKVDESVIIEGEGLGSFPGSTDIFASQITSTAETNSIGKAGKISISANELAIINKIGFISSSTSSVGDAADINIAVNKLSINDGFISSSTSSVGDAADINISTNNLSLTTGGQITAFTSGSGDAGNIVLNVSDTIFMDGVDSNGFSSGLFATVTEGATGQGGNIFIGKELLPMELSLTNDAIISTSTSGTGNAGDITLNIIDLLQVTDSEISTSSTQSSGGNLTITAGDIQLRGDSDLTTDIASGEGSGGSINIDADSVVAFDDSDIFAFAPEGQGGNITLNTFAFFAENFTLNSLTSDPNELDLNDRADVNATGAVSGAVEIPDVSFIQNSLTELPDNSINIDELVANSCVVPVGDRSQGKFIITGGESLPVRPGNNFPSKYPTGEVRGTSEDNTSSWQPGDPIIEPQGAYRLASGKLVLSRECS